MSFLWAKTSKRVSGVSPIFALCKNAFATSTKLKDCTALRESKPAPKSMWYNPVCCNLHCTDVVPRLDSIKYKPSDKFRKFQQTWCEPGEFRVVKKKLCCTEQYDVAPMEVRVRRSRHDGEISFGDKLEAYCKMQATGTCPKIKTPGCTRPCRNPPKCHVNPSPSKCKKREAPFPCYADCRHPKPRVPLPTECGCLHVRPFCPFGNEKQRIQ